MSEINARLYAQLSGKVQFGPVYRCFICDEPVRLIPFHEWVIGPTVLDRYADHIAYLDLAFDCKQDHHPARVAVVGPAIMPVDWPVRCTTSVKITAIRAAMVSLQQSLEERTYTGLFDKALVVALELHSQLIAPALGAQQIRALATSAA